MALSKNLKIRDCDLDDNLLRIVYGYKDELQKNFVDLVNLSLGNLEDKKQDKSDMKNYFHKTNDKIKKENIDSNYTNDLDTRIDALVDYNKLDAALKNRILNYESDAQRALAKTVAIDNSLDHLSLFESDTITSLNNIWTQIRDLDVRITSAGSSSGSSSGGTSSVQISSILDQIDIINSQITELKNKINDNNGAIENISFSQLDDNLQALLLSLQRQSEVGASDKPELIITDGGIGMIAVLGGEEKKQDGSLTSGMLHPAYIMLPGKIARSESEASNYVANAATNMVFCIYQSGNHANSILVRNGGIEPAAAALATESYNSSFKKIPQAFNNSWFAKNKFLVDTETGEVLCSVGGGIDYETKQNIPCTFITIQDPTILNTIRTATETLDSKVTTLEGVLPRITDVETRMTNVEKDVNDSLSNITASKEDIQTLKSDVSYLKTDVEDLKTDNTENKSEISTLKSDNITNKTNIVDIKSDITTIKSDIITLKSDIETIKADIGSIKSRLDTIETELKT